MKNILLFGLLVTIAALGACAQPASGEVLQSDKPRVTAPAADQAGLTALVDGNSGFAFDLYQALSKAEGNLFSSPYSISQALAMTYAGARGQTEKQMADTLHFTLPQNRLHVALNTLDLELAKRGQGAKGKDGEGLRTLDFVRAPEPSRNTINQWVSDQTEGRIKDLVPQGAINDLTRLVLTNAISFNAAWQSPFPKEATSSGDFPLLNGSRVTVPLMNQTGPYGYGEGDGYQAVELPYDGGELSMVVLL